MNEIIWTPIMSNTMGVFGYKPMRLIKYSNECYYKLPLIDMGYSGHRYTPSDDRPLFNTEEACQKWCDEENTKETK